MKIFKIFLIFFFLLININYTFSENITNTWSTTENITNTWSTTENITNTWSTTENITNTWSITENITNTWSTTENITNTWSTTENITNTWSTTENITNTWSTTENEKIETWSKKDEIINEETKKNPNDSTGSPMDYLIERKDKIKDRLWFEKTTTTEKEIVKYWDEIDTKKIEKAILEEIKTELNQKVTSLENELKSKYEEIQKLKIELNKKTNTTEELKKLNKEKTSLIYELKAIKIKLDDNKIQNKISSTKIAELTSDISELKIYKAKYDSKYLIEKKGKNETIIKNIEVYWIIILIFLFLHWTLNYLNKKYKNWNEYEKLNKVSILFILLYISFVFWTIVYLLIIKPEIALVFILLWSWILLSIRVILSSFFASFWIMLSYKLWDKVKIGEKQGTILEKNLLSLVLIEYDDNFQKTWRKLRIPNYHFLEKEITRMKHFNNYEKELNIALDLEKMEVSLNEVLKEIDNIFYKKKLDLIDTNNRWRYNIEIVWKKMFEYELTLNYKEINEDEIKMKIINKILELTKKESKNEKV